MELLGIAAERLAEYSVDVLSEVFGFGEMEYFVGIKLFNKVIDRLGVEMERQKRYEVFDGFMRRECERRSLKETDSGDKVGDLGAMA